MNMNMYNLLVKHLFTIGAVPILKTAKLHDIMDIYCFFRFNDPMFKAPAITDIFTEHDAAARYKDHLEYTITMDGNSDWNLEDYGIKHETANALRLLAEPVFHAIYKNGELRYTTYNRIQAIHYAFHKEADLIESGNRDYVYDMDKQAIKYYGMAISERRQVLYEYYTVEDGIYHIHKVTTMPIKITASNWGVTELGMSIRSKEQWTNTNTGARNNMRHEKYPQHDQRAIEEYKQAWRKYFNQKGGNSNV